MIETIDVSRVRHVLDGLSEQLVVRIDHRADTRTLSIVTHWPNQVPGADVAFARFELTGVRRFRARGRDGSDAGDLAGERSLVIARTFVPVGGRTRSLGIAFHGGGRVAGLVLDYEMVRATVRHARVVEGVCLDLESGDALAWKDPFGDARAGGC